MKKLGYGIILFVLFLLLVVGGNFVYGWNANGPAKSSITLVVPQGASLSKMAARLEELGALKSADTFLTRVRIFGGNEPIKAGEFIIPTAASNAQILQILQGNDVIERLFTIPEGMPSVLIHEKLMTNNMLKGEIDVPEEGSILPESYRFERDMDRAVLLARMQKAMRDTVDELWEQRSSKTVVKTKKEAVILASIVEKETGKASERKMIAGVYSNRLRKNMMLQADPTIIYPITKGKPLGRRIRQSEISAVNDYNTYAMTGLPKGPITNPGRDAIEAVLNPAQTSAYYFVADGSGGHIFSDTYKQHQENVEKWYALRRKLGEM